MAHLSAVNDQSFNFSNYMYIYRGCLCERGCAKRLPNLKKSADHNH